MVETPECSWVGDDGKSCGYKARTTKGLRNHVRETHLKRQLEAYEKKPSWEKRYECKWAGCRRRAPFVKYRFLRRHMISHTGSEDTEEQAAILREQLINVSRAPTGRRYSVAKRLVLRQYKSRASWQRMVETLPLPLPSLSTALRWKNKGKIDSGIDEQILQMMAEAAKTKPYLKHGILSLDEVYVNPQAVINSKNLLVFGYADNYPAHLAKSVLVFQYISLFSKRRFAIGVAWYGCKKLNANTVENWLWDVMIALQWYGFRVHALVCDGSPVNRKMQKTIVAQAKRSGQIGCREFVIQHPLTADPDARLFILSDPSHAMKKLRNCAHNRQMQFIYGDWGRFTVWWHHWQEVREWQAAQQRVDRRLTDKHLDLTHYEKMSVRYAVDVMSYPIDLAMDEIETHRLENIKKLGGDAMQRKDRWLQESSMGTRRYMGYCRGLWLAMNSRKTFFDETAAATIIENLHGLAEELRTWKAEMAAEPEERFLTDETYKDVLLICDGVPPFMWYVWNVLSKSVDRPGFMPKVISQDPLEKLFGALRQRGGGTQHITVKSIAYNLRAVNCNILMKFMPRSKLNGAK